MADAQAVINYLATRIAQLETDKAVLLADLAEATPTTKQQQQQVEAEIE